MNPEFIIDSHCHLDFDSLFFDLDNILKEAKKSGVKKMLDNISDWKNAPLWDRNSINKATKAWFKYLK